MNVLGCHFVKSLFSKLLGYVERVFFEILSIEFA